MSLAKKSSILRGDLRERMELTCFEVVYRGSWEGEPKSGKRNNIPKQIRLQWTKVEENDTYEKIFHSI